MCAIAGFCDFNKKSTPEELKAMTDVMYHRGPDSSGYEHVKSGQAYIGLGHRRLSVIDLSEKAKQPYKDEDGEFAVVYNGEIYNYAEIREELREEGFKFFSTSDTEVLLKAYIRWGIAAVHRFVGMFAFALHDRPAGKIYLFRDRAGVKPLYYYYKNGLFVFASELKAFHQIAGFDKEINSVALPLYFKFGHVPAPSTIFADTYKVKPGHYLELDLASKELKEAKYWDVYDYYNEPTLDIGEQEARDAVEKILISAFEYRLVADVPVGVFLSSGYDSTAVTAMLQANMTDKLKTFTIGFHDERHNEAKEAKIIADYLGTDHTEFYCTEDDAKKLIPELPFYYDEPFTDTSAIPTMLVSRLARQKVTVALSADGGDEVFAGYNHIERMVKRFKKTTRLWPVMSKLFGRRTEALADAMKRYGGYNDYLLVLINQFWKLRGAYGDKAIISVFTQGKCSDYKIFRLLGQLPDASQTFFANFKVLREDVDELNKCLAIAYQNTMADDMLTKVDRATMSVSLEGREPLLDHRIIELAARLPVSLKYQHGNKKRILKDIVHKYIPKELMDRPKRGFGIPIRKWLREDLSGYLHTYLSRDRLSQHNYFNHDYVSRVKRNYLSTGRDYQVVWPILMFQMWYERWMG